MRFNKIFTCDISDGTGIRVGLYTQGCSHKCEGCFNPETWDCECGREWTDETNDIIINMLREDRYKGLSILGGDPFFWYDKTDITDKNDMLLKLLKRVHTELNGPKSVWVWTGYLWEDLTDRRSNKFSSRCMAVLPYIDVLIDGKYEKNNPEGRKIYRGSANQRVIDVKQSLSIDDIVLYCE